jgi:hypothetical protein
MKNLRTLAFLGMVLVAFASVASASPISPYGEINFSGDGGLSGTAGSLLSLTLTDGAVPPNSVVSNTADLAIASGSFAGFPTTPGTLQPVTVYPFTSGTFPIATLFTTTFNGVTVSFSPTFFISSAITASGSSELIDGNLSETGYATTDAVLDLSAVANGSTFTADVITGAPEPSGLVLLGTGLVGASVLFFRRRRHAA